MLKDIKEANLRAAEARDKANQVVGQTVREVADLVSTMDPADWDETPIALPDPLPVQPPSAAPPPAKPQEQIFENLKLTDPLFRGCLVDFTLPEADLNRLLAATPQIDPIFRDGALITAGAQPILTTISCLEAAAHFMIDGMTALTTGPLNFQDLSPVLELTLHAMSRLHAHAIGVASGASEERKTRATLRDFVGRESKALLEDPTFFRGEAGSGGLPGTTASAMVTATSSVVATAPADPLPAARSDTLPAAPPAATPSPLLQPGTQGLATPVPSPQTTLPLTLPVQRSPIPRREPPQPRAPPAPGAYRGYARPAAGPPFARPGGARSPARPASQNPGTRLVWERRPDAPRSPRSSYRESPGGRHGGHR
jgi:hypothetical protein